MSNFLLVILFISWKLESKLLQIVIGQCHEKRFDGFKIIFFENE